MKSLKKILIIIIILGIVGGAVYFLFLQTKTQEEKIAQLNEEISLLKTESIPVRFKVVKREDNTTEVLVKFYDIDSHEVGKEKFKLKGKIISFDFMVMQLENGYIAFPTKIFTEEIKAESGTLLFNIYEKAGFPLIYSKKDASKEFKEGIEAVYGKIKRGEIEETDNIFGSMVQNNASTVSANKDIDVWYKIIVHTKGGIEIIEE